jgi:hypothetical protein
MDPGSAIVESLPRLPTIRAVAEEGQVFDFDGLALYEALDAQRQAQGLSWQGVANEIWRLSH